MEMMRQLDIEHFKRWERLPTPDDGLLAEQDCDPSLLNGWADRDLSLWDVSATSGKPSLERILVALCKNKVNFEKMGYVVFPNEVVTSAGLALTSSNGSTGDSVVDVSRTHFEIKNLSGKKLCTLISSVAKARPKTGIYKKTDLDKFLWTALQALETKTSARSMTRQGPASFIPPSGTQIVDLVPDVSDGTPSHAEEIIIPASGTTNTIAGSGNGTA